jgi:hypothetical protein
MNSAKRFSSDRNYAYCIDRNCTEVEQKKQPGTTKLLQELEVTVTQTKYDVMSENPGTKLSL